MRRVGCLSLGEWGVQGVRSMGRAVEATGWAHTQERGGILENKVLAGGRGNKQGRHGTGLH